MPRQSRIDTPGALHHIICRGIEQCKIFEDDIDRDNYVRCDLPGKQPHRVKARSVLICWAVQELGMSATAVGLKLGMSQSGASRAAQRGRNIVEELGLNPEKSRNA